MTEKLKIYIYAGLLILGIWFGWGFYASFSASTKAAASDGDDVAVVVAQTNTPAPSAASGTNVSGLTNAIVETTNSATASAPDTNAEAAVTNSTAVATSQVSAAKAPKISKSEPPRKNSTGGMIGYLGGLVAVIVCLGLLAAHDFSHFVGGRAIDFIFDDEGEEFRDPEYERGEKVWANGQFLEAIQIMRDYLKEHPQKQYVAIRIAEIYEKDLQNFLAAALEYEEILKQKLPPEKWGWTAIHLCNLYSRTGHPEKTSALLERIVAEYPNTAAAQKARTRLGMPEPEEAAPAEAASEGASEEQSKSNLPPGFRPKK